MTEETHERTHYDEALWLRCHDFIAERGITIGDFADLVGYSRATISKYLAKEYVNTVLAEASINRFFKQEERQAKAVKFVQTAVSMAVIEACEYASRLLSLAPSIG